MTPGPRTRRSRLPRGSAARVVAVLAAIVALFTARGAAAFERLPALGRLIEILPVTTCRVSPDAGQGASRPLSTEGSSILDVEAPPPALALPRARSGPDGRPGAEDAVAGTDGLVFVPQAPARRCDPGAVARAAALREQVSVSRDACTSHLARGPPIHGGPAGSALLKRPSSPCARRAGVGIGLEPPRVAVMDPRLGSRG